MVLVKHGAGTAWRWCSMVLPQYGAGASLHWYSMVMVQHGAVRHCAHAAWC
jgi:hypothetical protein